MENQLRDLSGALGSGQCLMNFNGTSSSVIQSSVRVNEGASWLHDELTSVEAGVTERLYDPQDGMVLCPLKDDLSWGTKKVKGHLTNSSGAPKLVQGVNPDIGKVSVGAEEMLDDVHTLALGFDVDIDELAASPRASEPWERVRTLDGACDRGIMERIDKFLVNGDNTAGIRAMFADKTTGQGTYTLLGAGGGHHLRNEANAIIHLTNSSSADDLADNLLLCLDRIYEATKKQIRPNRLALPLRLRNKCARKRLTDTGQSVLSYVVANSQFLKSEDDIIGVPALEGFFSAKGNKTATDAIIPYCYDESVVRTRILSARRHSVQMFPFGQCVVWAGRFHSPLWWRPLGVQIFENNWNYSAP